VNRRFRIILKAFVAGAMLEGMVLQKELRIQADIGDGGDVSLVDVRMAPGSCTELGDYKFPRPLLHLSKPDRLSTQFQRLGCHLAPDGVLAWVILSL
jgi:hypothetical protein